MCKKFKNFGLFSDMQLIFKDFSFTCLNSKHLFLKMQTGELANTVFAQTGEDKKTDRDCFYGPIFLRM